jgi:ABC-2 type transport system permease protein
MAENVTPLADQARTGRARLGWAFLGADIGLLYRRRRTWVLHAALAAVPVLIAIAVKVSSRGAPPGRGPQFLDQITHNGLFVALTGLVVSIPAFLPLTIAVVAGDTIAGEASHGTLRYLLIAPTGRLRLLVVKYVTCLVFCLSAPLAVAVAGLAIGRALFPPAPIALLSGDTISFGAGIWRTALIVLYIAVSLAGLSAIGLFISTLTTVPVGAMAAIIVAAVASQVLDAVPQLDWLHPWLFSHYWIGFSGLLSQPIEWSTFGQNLLLQAGYVLVAGALAWGRFSTKDVFD